MSAFIFTHQKYHLTNRTGEWTDELLGSMQEGIVESLIFRETINIAHDEAGNLHCVTSSAYPRLLKVFSNKNNEWINIASLPVSTTFPRYTTKVWMGTSWRIGLSGSFRK